MSAPQAAPAAAPRRLKGSALAAAIAAACALAAPLTMGFEGKRNVAYLDRLPRRPVPTTCFGHTGPEVKVGRRYSDRQCSVLLEGDLSREAVGVYRCGPPALAARPLVWAALTDLAHNIGVAGVCRSSAMWRFQTGRWREGCGRIALFDKAGGRVLPGLVRRRAREVALCLKGAEG
ncbi:MAG: lysozyme [Sphingomonadales bacterium]|jgi:lysozyme|nr:lysozyme [Sphingomonadales bacterium]